MSRILEQPLREGQPDNISQLFDSTNKTGPAVIWKHAFENFLPHFVISITRFTMVVYCLCCQWRYFLFYFFLLSTICVLKVGIIGANISQPLYHYMQIISVKLYWLYCVQLYKPDIVIKVCSRIILCLAFSVSPLYTWQ